ncbi:26S proteasome regulatory complex, ATPase RPT3, partial [Pseudoloma neurophilia]
DKLTCADLNSICQEAGMLAIRNGRYVILQKDFDDAYMSVADKKDAGPLLYG